MPTLSSPVTLGPESPFPRPSAPAPVPLLLQVGGDGAPGGLPEAVWRWTSLFLPSRTESLLLSWSQGSRRPTSPLWLEEALPGLAAPAAHHALPLWSRMWRCPPVLCGFVTYSDGCLSTCSWAPPGQGQGDARPGTDQLAAAGPSPGRAGPRPWAFSECGSHSQPPRGWRSALCSVTAPASSSASGSCCHFRGVGSCCGCAGNRHQAGTQIQVHFAA